MTHDLRFGDCLDVLRTLPDCSVDAVVTDPPYGLAFMGKRWDYDVPSEEVWRECLRVLKPGGHLLAFAGTRTQHRMAVRIEDAGFEIRDMIAWVYGSGFPKSLDVSKAIDKAAGAEREVVGSKIKAGIGGSQTFAQDAWTQANRGPIQLDITAPATPEAQQWAGWGTALKPALEPITVARKPFLGTVAANVLEHGTGALNVDGCRVGAEVVLSHHTAMLAHGGDNARPWHNGHETTTHQNTGRWPANLIHDGSDEVVACFPQAPGQQRATGKRTQGALYNAVNDGEEGVEPRDNGGSAARFFYCAKASKRDRDEGLDGFEAKHREAKFRSIQDARPHTGEGYEYHREPRRNTHPTVKPTDLMRYLCRLVTPPGGIVLDPFMGSGSTGKAANLEGFRFIGVERDRDYMLIAEARVGVKSDMPDWLR